MFEQVEKLRAQIPEVAKDIRLNLSAVLDGAPLSPVERWTVALAAAIASGSGALYTALAADCPLGDEKAAALDDAQAAAALMAMNNVYYRFRHFMHEAGRDVYETKPARLRMQRLARPSTSKATFELACLAVSAINACQQCCFAHEKTVLESGLTDDHVHEAVRIAATMAAAAQSLAL
jgi:alkyl hydroperoxide reductase subunit D